MSELTPVTIRSAVDETADRLLAAIALGEFSVGERLPTERELTVALGVSRPTVRAAMSRLRANGCIEVVRGRSGGHFVRSGWQHESTAAVQRVLAPRLEHSRELLDTRCLIESLIARTAAVRHEAADRPAIEATLTEHLESEGNEATRRADARLHAAIARAARNDELAAYSADLLARVSAGFSIEPFRGTYVTRARGEHRELVEAILARDGDRAASIAQAHFTITLQALDDVIQAAGRDGVEANGPPGHGTPGKRTAHQSQAGG